MISCLFHRIWVYNSRSSLIKYRPNFYIYRDNHDLFDKYNYQISTEEKHTPISLLFHQNLESLLSNSDLLNLMPCEFDLTSTTFRDTKILTYEIELPPDRNKNGFNLLNDEYFTIPYSIGIIPNS